MDAAKVTFEQAKELAREGSDAERAVLAARDDLPPELLYFLAEDGNPSVRRAVAENTAAPRQTDLILARDTDQRVRGELAKKIAAIAPDLSEIETSKVHAQTYEALQELANDQMEHVRVMLAEAIKDVVDAPADVIKKLASDLSIAVAGPVLEFSPVLTDDDLIDIIEQGAATGGVSAIARRSEVSENLADAIIGTDDHDGICSLLSNDSAQIREEALDDLITMSESVELWQQPLVGRAKLPAGAAQRMAGFLAESLLDQLTERGDLDDAARDVIKSTVKDRLKNGHGDKKPLAASFDFLTVETPLTTVERLERNGKLTPASIEKAMTAGDHPFVFAAMLVRGGVTEKAGRRIFEEKNPHGITALIARAGLPARMLVMIQKQMGRVAPSEVIEPDGDAIPMSRDDVDWQIDFFENLVSRS